MDAGPDAEKRLVEAIITNIDKGIFKPGKQLSQRRLHAL